MKAELPSGFICYCDDCKGRGLHAQVAALESVIDAMEASRVVTALPTLRALRQAIGAAVAAEREACALLAETAFPICGCEGDNAPCIACEQMVAGDGIGDAIRERRKK